MPVLTVKHLTTYRYKQPVAFGEHRMMLRPRDSYDQKLLDAKLVITPEPADIRWCTTSSVIVLRSLDSPDGRRSWASRV